MGELAELTRRQRAVGHGDPQHIGMELQVDAVHQAQRLEFVLAELAGEPAPDLPAELLHALFHESPVEFVVAVHGEGPPQAARSAGSGRSEEHTSELQSLMCISYAVFCLKKK